MSERRTKNPGTRLGAKCASNDSMIATAENFLTRALSFKMKERERRYGRSHSSRKGFQRNFQLTVLRFLIHDYVQRQLEWKNVRERLAQTAVKISGLHAVEVSRQG